MGRGEEHGQRQKWIEQVQLLASYAYKWRKQERERDRYWIYVMLSAGHPMQPEVEP